MLEQEQRLVYVPQPVLLLRLYVPHRPCAQLPLRCHQPLLTEVLVDRPKQSGHDPWDAPWRRS